MPNFSLRGPIAPRLTFAGHAAVSATLAMVSSSVSWSGTPAPTAALDATTPYSITSFISSYNAGTDEVQVDPSSASFPSGVSFSGTSFTFSGSQALGDTTGIYLRVRRSIGAWVISPAITISIADVLRWRTIGAQQFTLGTAANIDLAPPYLINPASAAGTYSHPSGTLQTGVTFNASLHRLEYDGGGAAGTTTGHTVDFTTTLAAPTWTSTPSFTFQEGVGGSFSLTPYLSAGTFTFSIISGDTAWLDTPSTSLVADGSQVDANSASLTVRATRDDGQYVDKAGILVTVDVLPSVWNGTTQIEFWANNAPSTSQAHLVPCDLVSLLLPGFEDNDVFSLAPGSPALPSFASFANSSGSTSYRLFTPDGTQAAGTYNFTLRYTKASPAQVSDLAVTIVVSSGASNGLQVLPHGPMWSYGMKHVGLIYCPASMTGGAGPLVFGFEGDYRGEAPYTASQSYQMGTAKIDYLAALAAPTVPGAGFSYAYPNSGRGGSTVQPKGPDFCGHPVDTLRGIIAHVPGVHELPAVGNQPPGCSNTTANDTNFRWKEMMKFHPNDLNSDTTWESWLNQADSHVAETWHCVYDAATDRYLRPNVRYDGELDVFNPGTGLWETSVYLGNNGLGQTPGIHKEYLACDWVQRKLYVADGSHHRLMCINLGTGPTYTGTTFEDLGLFPGHLFLTENYHYLLFHDTPHILEFLNIDGSHHYTCDAHVRPVVWTDRGRMPNHRAGVYLPSINKSMWGGGGEGSSETFLTFYEYSP